MTKAIEGGAAAPDEAGAAAQKILAPAGIASRRKAEEIILEGRVQVNGIIVTAWHASRCHSRPYPRRWQAAPRARAAAVRSSAQQAAWLCDHTRRSGEASHGHAVDGEAASPGRTATVVCTRWDGSIPLRGPPTDDNDGALANSLSKAAAGVKSYLVKVSGVPPASGLSRSGGASSSTGGRLDEVRAGVVTGSSRLRRRSSWFAAATIRGTNVTLTEGRNRRDAKVLRRSARRWHGYGALRLDVPPGEFRELTPGEVMALDRAAKGKKVVPRRNCRSFRS